MLSSIALRGVKALGCARQSKQTARVKPNLNRSFLASIAVEPRAPLRFKDPYSCYSNPRRYCSIQSMASRQTLAHEKGNLPILDPSTLPTHFSEEKEREWDKIWEESGIYRFDAESKDPIFSIDTPPPTASGKLHIGHIFSYSHTDMIARFQRMKGKNVFYPMGWDDNGLPTERRVQNYYHIWCSESAPYEPNLKLNVPTEKEKKKLQRRMVSRKNFVELCDEVTKMDEVQFKELFTRLGLSVDWREEYATINRASRRTAQLSFLDLFSKGHLYQSSSPSLWDIDFQTAIAQAEVEDRELDGAFHSIHFGVLDDPNAHFTIATTRPELLPACVAVAAHPEDARYQHLFGKKAISPIFMAPIPIFASESVDREKGTGILMICTFGDVMDVEWWRQQKLPLRQVIGRNGKLMESVSFIAADKDSLASDEVFLSIHPERANQAYSMIRGKNLNECRNTIVELLKQETHSAVFGSPSAPLAEAPRKISHPVKFFEKGSRPLELIPTKQWFLRLLDKKEALLAQGSKVQWKPEYMVKKYNDWVAGLNADWCISRQRFFGVPFPIWYPIDAQGAIQYDHPIIAKASQLPIDPMFDLPTGFTEEMRGKPNGFVAESDVFDTWWTSSLTPQIISGWMQNDVKHQSLYPASLRPQSHEIIRTWAFYTIVKSMLHENSIPWKEIAISGWIVDKDGSKVSKSAGNATVAPMDLLNKHFSDGVRYWTGSSRLGSDTIFEEPQMAVGRKLVMKLFNAGKLAFSHGPARSGASITSPMDLALLAQLKQMSEDANAWFSDMNFAKVVRDVEIWFWSRFTDNYLEMVKLRAKDEAGLDPEGRDSAILTMRFAMNVILRLLAPILPHITEEVWSWVLASSTTCHSIHKAPYPTAADFEHIPALLDETENEKRRSALDTAIAAADALRKCKTDAGLKFSQEVEHVKIIMNQQASREMESLWKDVLFSIKAQNASFEIDDTLPERAFHIRIQSASS
jgi:valyl-tRNA synthetase